VGGVWTTVLKVTLNKTMAGGSSLDRGTGKLRATTLNKTSGKMEKTETFPKRSKKAHNQKKLGRLSMERDLGGDERGLWGGTLKKRKGSG